MKTAATRLQSNKIRFVYLVYQGKVFWRKLRKDSEEGREGEETDII